MFKNTILALGMGMNMSAYSLALNSYFRKNRGKAVGYAMTITGLGPILMPQLIYFLTQIHAVQGVTLILAGIAAHSFVAASLLQPIKWHLKTEIIEEEQEEEEVKQVTKIPISRSRKLMTSELREIFCFDFRITS